MEKEKEYKKPFEKSPYTKTQSFCFDRHSENYLVATLRESLLTAPQIK
jgi:hypothetical protein